MTPPVPRGVVALVEQAQRMWGQAALEPQPAERYRMAHIAALRGAAAVLGVRPGISSRYRGRPTSAWLLLEDAAPELADWSAYFRDTAIRRAAVEAGSGADITASDADELVSSVSEFLAVTGRAIGVLPRLQTAEFDWSTSLAS